MKPVFSTVLSLLIVTCLQSQDDTKKIDALLRTYYKADAPGAMVIISKNQHTIFSKGYGLANMHSKEKIDAFTNFNIGSLTKQFTAFCILQLAAQQQLSLQDPLIKYFPDFNRQTGQSITLRHLLTHSSGITDHYAYTDTNSVKHATDKDVLQAVRNIGSTYFTPGSNYRYSNTAYCLLAMVIEKLSGLSYSRYMRQHVFQPLAMTHSSVLQLGVPIMKRAYGYEYDSSKNTFRQLDAAESIFFSTEGDGGIYTSANEYLQWYRSLQTPATKNKHWVPLLQSPQFPISATEKLFYGYGWFVSRKDSAGAVYHTGSNGGFRAIVFSIPSKDYLVVIFSNRTGIDLEKLVGQINDILHVTNNSFTKIEALVSFIHSSPIFAPCKEII